MTKYYVDACIWLDYYENRSDKFRPLGDWALQFLNKAVKSNNLVLYSRIVLEELEKRYDKKRILDIFFPVSSRSLLKRVYDSDTQVKEAIKLCKRRKVSFGDALHAILARDNGARVITRDKHFLKLQDITTSRKPEELI